MTHYSEQTDKSNKPSNLKKEVEAPVKIALRARPVVQPLYLSIVDGDNLFDYFKSLDKSPFDAIRYFAVDRSVVKYVFFFTYYKPRDLWDEEMYGYDAFLAQLLADEKRGLETHIFRDRKKGYSDFEIFTYILRNIDLMTRIQLFTSDQDYLVMVKCLNDLYGKRTEIYHSYNANQIIVNPDPNIGFINSFDMNEYLPPVR